MKLKKFKERDNKRIGIIVFTIVCILLVSGVILYRTFAIFEVKTNQNVIKGTVQGMGDIEFAFYIDDKIVKEAPSKDNKTSYVFDEESSTCTNGASVYWDYQRWGPNVSNLTQTKTKCYLKFKTEYNESILNGAVPKLKDELVPVTIDENGTVRKADITTEWYKYGEQRWANAVILRDGKIDDYAPKQEIKEEDIESYFVWIPRYKYQLWNGEEETSEFIIANEFGQIENTEKPELNQQQEIKIEFESKHMSISVGNLKNQWFTHPAFTSFESNGFWVGKFETGYKGATNSTEAQVYEKDITKVIIKPNVYSWRNIQISNAFGTSKDYKTNLDSHMMKNMEWGAVAYLTYSKYGRCQDDKCEEVRINNSSNYVTGSSARNAPTCGYTGNNQECNKYEESIPGMDNDNTVNYKNKASNFSSTTGNYSGIYDMAGGAWEFMTAFINNQIENIIPNEFMNISDKYYNSYNDGISDREYIRGHLGDGTKEFGTFYHIENQIASGAGYMGSVVSEWSADHARFLYSGAPYFIRGAAYDSGTNAGICAFISTPVGNGEANTFRIVLTP